MKSDEGKYADIIDMPHHVSKKHRPMDIGDRAAQFSPFAALSGFDRNIEERAESELVKTENEIRHISFDT